eukprot:TRINITY_DN28348_c0_g1_i1.p1 TRINITY_DN28348_c0_g1~~TRINITY_DN28348_c0_g1_i1.p1  ORF type:complete len:186 (+),score=56.19 TRINITY_DN28348_c0_g1_i1:40-597(+)
MEDRVFIVLFGNPGVGKSYIGSLLESNFGFYWYDADVDLTEEMKEAIENGNTFTQEMRDTYYHNIILNIQKLFQVHTKLVVSQALIKRQNRLQIRNHFPTARFVWVQAEDELVEQRITKRQEELLKNPVNTFQNHFKVGPELTQKIRTQFEEPQPPENTLTIINNNNTQQLLHALHTITQPNPIQ